MFVPLAENEQVVGQHLVMSCGGSLHSLHKKGIWQAYLFFSIWLRWLSCGSRRVIYDVIVSRFLILAACGHCKLINPSTYVVQEMVGFRLRSACYSAWTSAPWSKFWLYLLGTKYIDYVNMTTCVECIDSSHCIRSSLIKMAPAPRHAENETLSPKAWTP